LHLTLKYNNLKKNHLLILKSISMKVKLFLLSLFFSVVSFGQQAIDSSGGNATGSGGSASYSVGQITYQSYSGSTGKVSQGVQQPFEIFVTLKNNEFNYSFTANLYPNPTASTAILSLENQEPNGEMEYNLTDITGKLITKGNINAKETVIDVAILAEACYFLNVISENKTIKTFKLLKHN
jgi:Secretion system C-terminal sorting domain